MEPHAFNLLDPEIGTTHRLFRRGQMSERLQAETGQFLRKAVAAKQGELQTTLGRFRQEKIKGELRILSQRLLDEFGPHPAAPDAADGTDKCVPFEPSAPPPARRQAIG